MTTKINYVNSQIRIGEMGSLAEGVKSKKALLNESTDTHLLGVIGRLETTFGALSFAVNEMQVRSKRADFLKEEVLAFRSLHQLVKGYAGLQNASVSTAANAMLEVLNHYYSKITQQRGQKEIHTQVTSLLGDLDNASMQAIIPSMMYCEGAVAKLKEAQAAYLEQYIDYRTARDKQVAQQNASVLTKELVQLINHDLVDYLNAMSKVETVDYSDFSAAVAALINEHNIICKTRKTRSLNKVVVSASENEPEPEA
ncbi:MAG: DUF6261 family protein [Mangrovibacterium sp.]